MIKKYLFFIFMNTYLFIGCVQDKDTQNKSKKETIDIVKRDGSISNADIIRSPVTGEGTTDTINIAKITFEEMHYDFGDLKQGKIVKHNFTFRNTGKIPLYITHVSSTCGCTIPEWPKEPIGVDETGQIKVQFNSKGKMGTQNKPISITANTYPNKTKIYITANVKK